MESLPTEAEDAAARRERKLRARVWNDRVKSIAAVFQGLVLILLGVGGLRFVLDPAAPTVTLGQLALTVLIAFALEGFVLYILGRQLPED